MTTQTGAPNRSRSGAPGAGGGALHSEGNAGARHRPIVSARVIIDLTADTPAECLDALRYASPSLHGRRVILRTGALGPAGLHAADLLGGTAGVEIHGDSRHPQILDEWLRELETLE